MTEQHDSEPEQRDGIWVTSDANPDGSPSYIVTVSVSDDVALSLKADAAVRYVATVTRAAVLARHDAAVMRQLTGRIGLTVKDAGYTIAEMRQDREPVHDEHTAPLRFEPIVAARDLGPYVHVWAGDKRISQWEPDDCIEHASYVMQCLAGADLDSAYLLYLKRVIGVEDEVARAAVHALGTEVAGINDESGEATP